MTESLFRQYKIYFIANFQISVGVCYNILYCENTKNVLFEPVPFHLY